RRTIYFFCAFCELCVVRDPSGARGGVRGDREHLVVRQVGDDRLHQIRPHTLARAALRVEQLADGVARRAAGDTRDWTETLQIRTVADRALRRLVAAGRDQRFALFDT